MEMPDLSRRDIVTHTSQLSVLLVWQVTSSVHAYVKRRDGRSRGKVGLVHSISSITVPFTVVHLPYLRFMLLFESIFSLSFCLARQPSLYFTVSCSTDKGSEVTFYCQISILSDLSFSLETAVQEAWIKQQENSCSLTNITCQLFFLLDPATCTTHSWGQWLHGKTESHLFEDIWCVPFTNKQWNRGQVLHTLFHDILHPHIYSSVLLLSKLQLPKKKGMTLNERRLESSISWSCSWCEILKVQTNKPNVIKMHARGFILNISPSFPLSCLQRTAKAYPDGKETKWKFELYKKWERSILQ